MLHSVSPMATLLPVRMVVSTGDVVSTAPCTRVEPVSTGKISTFSVAVDGRPVSWVRVVPEPDTIMNDVAERARVALRSANVVCITAEPVLCQTQGTEGYGLSCTGLTSRPVNLQRATALREFLRSKNSALSPECVDQVIRIVRARFVTGTLPVDLDDMLDSIFVVEEPRIMALDMFLHWTVQAMPTCEDERPLQWISHALGLPRDGARDVWNRIKLIAGRAVEPMSLVEPECALLSPLAAPCPPTAAPAP